MEPVEVVKHHHVEWRGRRALFFIAADVQVRVIGPAISQPVNQPRIAVKSEDDRFVFREEDIEIFVVQAVRVFACGLETHEVHDVDYTDF